MPIAGAPRAACVAQSITQFFVIHFRIKQVLYVRSRILLAARAAGVEYVLDGSYANIRDAEGLRVCCEAARKLGYRGKSVIHPNQVAIVNRAFTPPEKEVDYYKRVIEAFDAAVARGSAATTVDGKLVDYAMAAMAKRVLAWGGRAGKVTIAGRGGFTTTVVPA
jgi:citrate lyase subunit beta / citryl-CoA lyase